MKKLTALLCALFLLGNGMTPALYAYAETMGTDPAITETAGTITVDDMTFTVWGDHLILTGCASDASEIVIPSEVEGRPVTEIGDNAFAGLTSLTSVLIPESVTTVSTTAFEGTSLKKVFLESYLDVYFPYAVDVYEYYHIPYDTAEYTMEFQNSISYRKYSDHIEIMEMDYLLEEITVPAEIDGLPVTAFRSPIRNDLVGGITTNGILRSVTIPETVTDLSLAYCTALEETILEGDNPAYTLSGGVLFSKDMTVLEQYPLGLTEASYIIPDSVQMIEAAAFGMSNLQSVTIPEGVTTIGDSAFISCEQLNNVVLPDSVTSIGRSAFERCYGLTSINIPEGVTTIERGTFIFCENLENVTLPDSLTYIDEAAFYGSGITELVIPERVTALGPNPFTNCTKLTSVKIPAGLTQMENYTFSGCTSLKNFDVDSENPAFCDLNGVLMSKDRTVLIDYPDARSGKHYTIPASVTEVRTHAFADCCNLESILIPETVTTIGSYAFADCANLRSAVILADCGTIADYAFSGNEKLSEIVLTNRLNSVDFRAFSSVPEPAEVYYLGSEQEWNAIEIGSSNEALTNGNLHFDYVYTPVSLGNLNGDAVIDSSDAAMLLITAANEGVTGVNELTAEQQHAADVITDGICNAADAAMILRYAAYTGSGGTESLSDWMA